MQQIILYKNVFDPSHLLSYERKYGCLTSKIGQIFAKFRWPG